MKKYWRCTICGDLHFGNEAPATCPTCHNPKDKAIEISKEEFIELASK